MPGPAAAPHPPGPTDSSGVGPGGITLVAPTTSGTTTGGSLYGLGQWGKQTVDPGDLPFLSGIVSTGGNTTGDSIVQAFAGAAPDQVATIQHALYMAGYYPKTYAPKYGVISPTDVSAFGHLVTTAGQAGQPVAALLAQGAAYGAAAGIAAAQAKAAGKAKTVAVNLPNATDLEAAAVAAFQKELGHKASPQAAAAFAAQYRAMSAGIQRTANQQVYDASAGVNPDVPQGDPAKMVQHAVTTPDQRLAQSQQNNPDLGPVLAHELGTGYPVPKVPDTPFADQIGGLMKLGQKLADPGSAQQQGGQQGGLTQVDVESPVSPDVAALNYARNTHPNQAAANDVAGAFDMFLSLLFNGVGA